MGLAVRNKGITQVKVSELVDAPWNYRTHPDAQREALEATVEEIGWYGYPDVYEAEDGSLCICDGHLRKSFLVEKYGEEAEIDVNVTDFDENEARIATATHDPLTAMAEHDQGQLDALIQSIDTNSETLNDMFADLATQWRSPRSIATLLSSAG